MVIVDKNGSLSYGHEKLIDTLMYLIKSPLRVIEKPNGGFEVGVVIEPGYVSSGEFRKIAVSYSADFKKEEVIGRLMNDYTTRNQVLSIYKRLGYTFLQAQSYN